MVDGGVSSRATVEDLTLIVDREILVMSELDHPHIVHLDEVYEDKETVCFVMELAKGGEVFNRLVQRVTFDEISAADHIRQLLSGWYLIRRHIQQYLYS